LYYWFETCVSTYARQTICTSRNGAENPFVFLSNRHFIRIRDELKCVLVPVHEDEGPSNNLFPASSLPVYGKFPIPMVHVLVLVPVMTRYAATSNISTDFFDAIKLSALVSQVYSNNTKNFIVLVLYCKTLYLFYYSYFVPDGTFTFFINVHRGCN
jgi:hypothetical protein